MSRPVRSSEPEPDGAACETQGWSLGERFTLGGGAVGTCSQACNGHSQAPSSSFLLISGDMPSGLPVALGDLKWFFLSKAVYLLFVYLFCWKHCAFESTEAKTPAIFSPPRAWRQCFYYCWLAIYHFTKIQAWLILEKKSIIFPPFFLPSLHPSTHSFPPSLLLPLPSLLFS